MKLTQLDAHFICWYTEPPTERERKLNPQWPPNHLHDCYQYVETLAEAHGILFMCPKHTDGHYIQVFFEGSPIPDRIGKDSNGNTVRWKVSGTSLNDLTLTPSIEEKSDCCGWHGYVTNGEAK